MGSPAFAESAYILVWPNRKTYTELASRRYHKPLELLMPSLLLRWVVGPKGLETWARLQLGSIVQPIRFLPVLQTGARYENRNPG